jgi:putative endonuclease
VKRRSPSDLGRVGEEAAARLLRRDGARILGRNVRTAAGEMDLLALEDGTLVVVEVKARTGSRFGSGEEAVDASRLRRLERSAQVYAAAKGLGRVPVRIDVVAVEFEGGRVARCRRLRGVTS